MKTLSRHTSFIVIFIFKYFMLNETKIVCKQNNNINKQIISPILILLTPAVEVPAQLIATTEYTYTYSIDIKLCIICILIGCV